MQKDLDLEKIRDVLVSTALEAGELIRQRNGTAIFDDKKNSVDLVTEVDKAVEDFIRSRLLTAFPQFKFFGEESFVPGVSKITEEPTFVVDPIDGTTNFIHSFPFSCTSLGFMVGRKPVIGVVYNPHLNQMFSAISGHGAFLNGIKLPMQTKRSLKIQSSLVALEGGTDRHGNNFDVKFATFKRLLAKDTGSFIHGFRCFGSAAMNLCYVAMGQMDAYWANCWSWDVCAAWVISHETGGIVVDGNKNNWKEVDVENRVFLFVRGAPAEEQKVFVEEFWGNIEGRLDV
ncbi:unnamed protein product [Kuraishia capsulata CBS 1993]|uniref:Inositol-1-monophosphatase n=1 Tax=Kuraishia capsulata CBS 1993 TaxID=1382522 RepID=W6MQN5_9ASCO|nr:uncharacterized protein KUCA_T00004642001 [Kuraishia capsulata CBS 1993]CDK28658.1 unnamed protein product [Kuraishia capsulata CBS 1993]